MDYPAYNIGREMLIGMRWLRAVYAVEFLLAVLVAVFTWPSIAGQDHVDYVPWEWKLGLTLGFAAATVLATRAAVSEEKLWSAGVVRWVLVVLLTIAGMGYMAYQSHLGEEEEEAGDVFRS